jgi:hypothetical protein
MNTSAHAQENHLVWLNWRGYLWLSWIGLIVLALGGGLALLRGNLGGGFVLIGALLLSGGVIWIHPLPNLFKLLCIVAVSLNANGYVWQLFGMPGPYDEITHAFTIFFLTLALGVLIYGPCLRGLLVRPMLFVVLIACLGIALGALWEVVEWFVDLLPFIRIINPLADTISDLIVDSLGALLAGLLSCWIVNRQQRKE